MFPVVLANTDRATLLGIQAATSIVAFVGRARMFTFSVALRPQGP